jgi:hypothetical protein
MMSEGPPWSLGTIQVHEGRNTSATAPVKVLAFYVAEKGQPLTTAVPD